MHWIQYESRKFILVDWRHQIIISGPDNWKSKSSFVSYKEDVVGGRNKVDAVKIALVHMKV